MQEDVRHVFPFERKHGEQEQSRDHYATGKANEKVDVRVVFFVPTTALPLWCCGTRSGSISFIRGSGEGGDLKLAVAAGAGDDFSGVFFFSSHAELAVWALEFHGSY